MTTNALPAPATHKRDNEDAAEGVERMGLSRRDLPTGGRVVLAPIQSATSYVQELRANHGLYRQWADDPDQALNRTDVIEGDPVVKACVRYLGLLAVGQCGKNWSCTTDHDELAVTAAVIEAGLRQATGFLKARMALARAVTRGMALVHVAWEPRVCRLRPDMQPRQWMVPARFTVVDKRRLRLFRVEGRRDLAYWAIWEPGTDAYVLLEDRSRNPAVPAGFAVQDFIWYRSEQSERSAGFGEGEGDQLFEIVGISQRCMQYRARLAERWAEPTFIYGLDVGMGVLTEATMGEAFKSPYKRAEDFHATMEKWRGRHSLTIPKHDELNIHEHGGPSAAALEDFLRYIDNLKRTDILLGGLMDDGGGGGNTFGDDGGAEARTDAVAFNAQFHRAGIEEACEEGLVWEFARRNATTLMQAGFQVPYRGEIGISFASKRAGNADVLMKRLEVAGQRGLLVGKSWLHEELDIPEPKPGEAVAVAAPAAPAVGPDGLPLPGGMPGAPPASPFQFARGFVPAWRRDPAQYAFNEGDHPRDDAGKFTGGVSRATAEKAAKAIGIGDRKRLPGWARDRVPEGYDYDQREAWLHGLTGGAADGAMANLPEYRLGAEERDKLIRQHIEAHPEVAAPVQQPSRRTTHEVDTGGQFAREPEEPEFTAPGVVS